MAYFRTQLLGCSCLVRTATLIAAVAAYGNAQIPNLRRPVDKLGPPLVNRPASPVRVAQADLKEYARNQYQVDLAFRERVDELYSILRYEHSLRSYNRNRKATTKALNSAAPGLMEIDEESSAQQYLNKIGRRLVRDRETLYVFKLIRHPVLLAESLSNGSIYVSTGLIAAAENESQVAYVVAHEIAHIALDHWKAKLMEYVASSDYNAVQDLNQNRLSLKFGFLGLVPQPQHTLNSADFRAALNGERVDDPLVIRWPKQDEDEADDFAFNMLADAGFDSDQPHLLLAKLARIVGRDTRAGVAFMGQPDRLKMRMEKCEYLASRTPSRPQQAITTKASDDGFNAALVQLRRENGFLALDFDMLEMARSNFAAAFEGDPADNASRKGLERVTAILTGQIAPR